MNMERHFEQKIEMVNEVRFKLKKAIDGLVVGKLFDPFGGLVSGITLSDGRKLKFSDKEYFDLIHKQMKQRKIVCRIK